MPRPLRRLAPALAWLVGAQLAAAAPPDWEALRELETVEVVTRDERGEARETTVWLVVLDGEGYLRTGRTRWGAEVERSRELVLRAPGTELPLRVELVEDDALRGRVAQAFRAKYGLTDRLVSWPRGSRPRIMRLRALE